MEAGQRVRDFILVEKIGAGGVGEVWRARHQHLDTTVAIKAIHPHIASNVESYARFLREAQAMASLAHPHIVQVHDFFSLDGHAYLVMAYIGGESLHSVVQRRGRLSVAEALQISRDILEALAFAHRQGIIHRDVKPSNILVQPDGQAFLMDFGIALIWGQERITQMGVPIGTAEYMSPEQIQGSNLDHHTDVYSFGCVLYEMLAGRPPFGGREEEQVTEYTLMQNHLTAPPAPLRQLNPEVDQQLEAVVMRALAKEPGKRFGGCEEMAQALRSQPSPPPPPPDGRERKTVERSKHAGFRALLPKAGITLLVVVLLLSAVYLLTNSRPSPTPGGLAKLTPEVARKLAPYQLQCAAVTVVEVQNGVVTLGGRVASEAQGAEIRRVITQVAGVTQVKDTWKLIPPPFCEVVELLDPLRTSMQARQSGVAMRLEKGEKPLYVAGENLVIEVRSPQAFQSYVYVDYYTADRYVGHLFPNPKERTNVLRPDTTVTVGRRDGPQQWNIVAPFGLELVTVIASREPLFSPPRFRPESAESYLKVLRPALKRAMSSGIVSVFHFITTREKAAP